MITLNKVVRRYGRGPRAVEAITGVTLELARGRVTAFVGPNGAGKSTLFGLILGFLGATAGEVRIEGSDPRPWVRRQGAGWLPDRLVLPGEWTVRQALRGLAQLDGLADPTAAADAALVRFGLEQHASVPAARLSRGLLQRLGLAQALLAPHPLLVLDEPAQGLDPVWRIRLRDEIRAAREAGATILLASHDLAEVERVADVAIVLEAGRVVEQVSLDGEASVSSWLLGVSGPTATVSETFARAREVAPGDWEVEAADAADLSARLAALLAAGVIVHRVEPVRDGLETRVRRRAEDAQ